MRITSAFPTGVTALLFEAAERRRTYEDSAVTELRSRGFAEAILPILDYFDPYEGLVSDRAREELYRFVDRDGELLALRGDFTPMLARVLAPRVGSLELPLRLFYRGDRVRHQEERPGRLREYYEMGAELLGVPGRDADEEMLELFLRILSIQSGPSLRVVLSFAGALDRLLLQQPADSRAGLLQALSRRDRRVVRQAGATLLQVVEEGRPVSPGDLGDEGALGLASLEELIAKVQAGCDDLEVTFNIDLAEFAQDTLDPELAAASGTPPYYDGPVFKAYVEGQALSAGRGGRYDRLFRRLGADLAAVGFSVSPDRILGGSTS